MASLLASSLPLLLLIIFSSFESQSSALEVPLNTSIPSELMCKSTPHPSVCTSILPHENANVYDFGRFSVRHSFLQSEKLLVLIENYFRKGSRLSRFDFQTLQDCKSLALLNVDFLSNALETVNKSSHVLPSSDADDVQTLLSAILTNQHTCLDGLEDASLVLNDLLKFVSNGTSFYSVSLALVTKGWVPKGNKNNVTSHHESIKHVTSRKGRLSLKMSSEARGIYDTVISRKRRDLFHAGDEGIPVKDIVVVCQDGNGDFRTITDAINAAPNNPVASDGYFLIYVTAGVYEEYVSILTEKKYILMIGDGLNRTIITGNKSVGGGSTTYSSATLAVVATGFIAVNITIRNTAGPSMGQAVALLNGADFSVFYICSIEGYQDTLYAQSMRQFYRECDVFGTIDFIFGNSALVLQNCNIYPRKPLKGQSNPITAQGRTDPNQNTGTSIHNCTITAAADLASSNFTVKTYLGRPWKMYSRTVYLQSLMHGLIDAKGWLEWDGDFALRTLYYGEYGNRGRGAKTSRRVDWPGYHVMGATDATNFTVSNFLLGDRWLPQTGVPYTGGLI